MPTLNELLKRLPKDIAEKVERNISDNLGHNEFKYCAHLICSGFIWRDSPEGWHFWDAVHTDCIANKI